MNPTNVTGLRELTDLYGGNAAVATLVFAVVWLFMLLRATQREHLKDARAFGEAAAKLSTHIEANTRTIQASVSTLDEASDTLRIAFELMGPKRRREAPPKPEASR